MSSEDIDKSFVSPVDQFLFTFDANHPKSHSQQNEIAKYQRIFKLRDAPHTEDHIEWDQF